MESIGLVQFPRYFVPESTVSVILIHVTQQVISKCEFLLDNVSIYSLLGEKKQII